MKIEGFKKYIWIVILIILLVLIDQGIKLLVEQKFMGQDITVINGVLKFTCITNEGLAFSIGKTRLSAIITDIIVIAMVVRFLVVQRDKMYKITQISLSLIVSGGLGNLIDRIFRGEIIDYFNLEPLIQGFPIFNLSDILIIIGFVIFAITVLINILSLRGKKEKQN